MAPRTPADMLTLARMLLAPIVLIAIALTRSAIEPLFPMMAFVLFVVAAFTDAIDGFVARRTGSSDWGARWDPIADKALVWGAIVGLALAGTLGGIHLIPAILIIVRDILVDLARRSRSIPVSWLGKTKTVVVMVAIALLLAGPAFTALRAWEPGGVGLWMFGSAVTLWLGTGLLWLGALLAVISAAGYLGKPKAA